MEEFTNGGFKEVIDDTFADAAKVKKVLFCSGKIYFDLAERQQKENRKDIAIVRVEQIVSFAIISNWKNCIKNIVKPPGSGCRKNR